jgi:hypothetical protein
LIEKRSEVGKDYQVQVITSASEMNIVHDLWEKMQWHPMADYELFRLVVDGRLNVESPCVLVVRHNEKPVALMAGRIEKTDLTIRFGYATVLRIAVRQLLFIVGGYMGERTQVNWERLLSCIDSLMAGQKIDLVVFEQLKVGSIETDCTRHAMGRIRFSPAGEPTTHWLLSLPPTWDGFLRSRSSKHRYWLKRLPKVLDREFPGEWKTQVYRSPLEAREFVEAAEAVAGNTYQRGLGVGFHDGEETLGRVDLYARSGSLRGYVLFIRDTPKAFWYCFTYGNTLLYLAATGYDPRYRAYELGTVLLMDVFRDHCGTGIEVIDFGPGDADYKRRFGSQQFGEASYYLFSKTARGLCLRSLHGVRVFTTVLAHAVLDRLRLTQRLKTYWRRNLGTKQFRSEGAEAEESQHPARQSH